MIRCWRVDGMGCDGTDVNDKGWIYTIRDIYNYLVFRYICRYGMDIYGHGTH